jgi:hypothetical protein
MHQEYDTHPSGWFMEAISGIAYMCIPLLASQCLGAVQSGVDSLLFFAILSAYGASYLTCATEETVGTAWRGDVGRTTLLLMACTLYIWVIVFASLEPRVLRIRLVALFRQWVWAWLLVQGVVFILYGKFDSWKHAAWGRFSESSRRALETVEIFARTSLLVQGAWIMYLLHYSYMYASRRLDLLALLVAHGYRLLRRGTQETAGKTTIRLAGIKPVAPLMLLMYVIEPAFHLYSISFNVDDRAPSSTRSYILVALTATVLIEIACTAWDKKGAIIEAVARGADMTFIPKQARILPEMFDAELVVLLSTATFAMSRDVWAFAWPCVSVLTSVLVHGWSDRMIK